MQKLVLRISNIHLRERKSTSEQVHIHTFKIHFCDFSIINYFVGFFFFIFKERLLGTKLPGGIEESLFYQLYHIQSIEKQTMFFFLPICLFLLLIFNFTLINLEKKKCILFFFFFLLPMYLLFLVWGGFIFQRIDCMYRHRK